MNVHFKYKLRNFLTNTKKSGRKVYHLKQYLTYQENKILNTKLSGQKYS